MESIWGPQAAEFIPERFGSDSGKMHGKNHLQNKMPESEFGIGAYPHFNGGARKCIGQEMALLEIKAMVATLLKKYEFTLVSDEPATCKEKNT